MKRGSDIKECGVSGGPGYYSTVRKPLAIHVRCRTAPGARSEEQIGKFDKMRMLEAQQNGGLLYRASLPQPVLERKFVLLWQAPYGL